MPARFLVLTLCACLAGAACADRDAPGDARPTVERTALGERIQWRLPGRLREISGLAVTPDGRVLAVTDEVAVVYELDPDAGRLVKAYSLGDPPESGDFEGIAWADGRVWLVTSKGHLYAAPEGADGEQLHYEVYRTGLDDHCEIEGLEASTTGDALLLACKRMLKHSKGEPLALYRWSLAERELDERGRIDLPEEALAGAAGADDFNPSGLADAGDGRLLLVAARQATIAEVGVDGTLRSAQGLPGGQRRHRQAEGIAMLPDGRLLIADEGGNGSAILSVYDPTTESEEQ